MKKSFKVFLLTTLCIGLLTPTSLALQNSGLIKGESFRVEDYYYKSLPKRTASSQADLSGALGAMRDAIERVDADVNISSYGVHISQMSELFSTMKEEPAFFYFTGLSYNYYTGSGIVVTVTFKYDGVKENILPMKALYNQALDKALQIFDPAMSSPEKALIAHDYLVLNTKYDYENLLTDSIPHISHTAYGSLVLGVAVCDGYSSAYNAMLSRMGLEVINISSDSMSHAWNMVKLGSYWYHVDATFDDPIFNATGGWYNDNYDLEGYVRHKYFLLSDAKIAESGYDHTGWSSPYTAGSSLYDGKYNDIKSGMFWQGGFWYYNLNGNIKRSDFNLNNATTIKASVNGYDNLFSYLGLYNNRLYYNYTLSGNSKSSIKSIKLDGSDERDELTIDNTGQSVKEQITELLVLDGSIRYTVCRHISSSNRLYEVRSLELGTAWSLTPIVGSSAVIDEEKSLIYGLEAGLSTMDLLNFYLNLEGNVYIDFENNLGTGYKVNIFDNTDGTILASYTILIFGDLNGDGTIDSADAGTISDVENFILDWDSSVITLYESAADLNGDGIIDSSDAGLITDAENFLVLIDQTTGLAA